MQQQQLQPRPQPAVTPKPTHKHKRATHQPTLLTPNLFYRQLTAIIIYKKLSLWLPFFFHKITIIILYLLLSYLLIYRGVLYCFTNNNYGSTYHTVFDRPYVILLHEYCTTLLMCTLLQIRQTLRLHHVTIR